MISKDCAWMIRDIYRLAKHNLLSLDAPAVEDGIVLDGEYHCIFRLRLHSHDSFVRDNEVMVQIAEGHWSGFIELNDPSTVERVGTGSILRNGYNIATMNIVDPFSDLDFCADWEAAEFQAECISDGMEPELVDAFILHNFVKDLSERNFCFILNTDMLQTDGKFDFDKVQRVHNFFFD